jgi:hypothetical protein
MDNHLALNYGSYYGEVTYGTASYAYTYDHLQTFQVGVNYVNYGSFEGYDESNLPLHLLEVKLHFQQGMPTTLYYYSYRG